MRAPTFFDADRLTLTDSIALTEQALLAHLGGYRHLAIAYSGGKDSSATVTLVAHLIETGRIPRPESLTVLYADTRMELPPLQIAAFGVLDALAARGVETQVVLPALDDRYFVYVLGRGVPPPKNNFRWCTSQLKIEPMLAALAYLMARPPVFLDEPYQIDWLLSYCDSRQHRGVIYRAAGFELYRTNDAGLQTWRLALPALTPEQHAAIAAASAACPRARRFRAERDGERAQLPLEIGRVA